MGHRGGGGGAGESTYASARVLGWTVGLFILSGLFMFCERDQSWLQNANTLQSCNPNSKNVNVSMALEKEEDKHNNNKNVNVSMALEKQEDNNNNKNVNVSMALEKEEDNNTNKNVNVSMALEKQEDNNNKKNVNVSMALEKEEDNNSNKNVNVSRAVEKQDDNNKNNNVNVSMAVEEEDNKAGAVSQKEVANGVGECNLFRGKWVYDESYALYVDGSCPFASNDFNCRKNGRVDSGFERWRWQPHDCDLPRFNASLMLETLRGKRLMYVGDSINRNQWESMLCLLRAVVPYDRGNMKAKDNGGFLQYFIKGYNCSIEFSWAPFLVRQNQNNGKETLGIDIIAQQSQHWRDADILVFNSGHWWTHEQPYEGVNYFEEGGQVVPYMEELAAFDKALRTWAKWIQTNINPHKTKVYFRGYSPVHFHGKVWGKKVGGGCFNETEPIDKMGQEAERIYGERRRMEIVEKVVGESKNGVKVKLLNVTGLSMYRKDAHASVYTSKYSNLTNKNDYSYADCSHWCLPGLPDVWNNILYALLI